MRLIFLVSILSLLLVPLYYIISPLLILLQQLPLDSIIKQAPLPASPQILAYTTLQALLRTVQSYIGHNYSLIRWPQPQKLANQQLGKLRPLLRAAYRGQEGIRLQRSYQWRLQELMLTLKIRVVRTISFKSS